MAKKKNPLKDLNAFLDHQKEAEEAARKAKSEAFLKKEPSQLSTIKKGDISDIDTSNLPELLKQLAHQDVQAFKEGVIEQLIQHTESKKELETEDYILINALIRFQNPKNWKEAISEYWKL